LKKYVTLEPILNVIYYVSLNNTLDMLSTIWKWKM